MDGLPSSLSIYMQQAGWVDLCWGLVGPSQNIFKGCSSEMLTGIGKLVLYVQIVHCTTILKLFVNNRNRSDL